MFFALNASECLRSALGGKPASSGKLWPSRWPLRTSGVHPGGGQLCGEAGLCWLHLLDQWKHGLWVWCQLWSLGEKATQAAAAESLTQSLWTLGKGVTTEHMAYLPFQWAIHKFKFMMGFSPYLKSHFVDEGNFLYPLFPPTPPRPKKNLNLNLIIA